MTDDQSPIRIEQQVVSIVDLDDFESVYRSWAPRLYGYCYRRLGSVENAEDATSLVFQKAFRARGNFKGGSVPAWLFRIADRVVVDHYRATRPVAPIDSANDISDRSPGPELVVIQRDEAARLERAIASLPEMRRRVIELRLAGLTSPDIARILDRTPDWVRTNQYRAVLQLQDSLQAPPVRGDSSDG